MRETTTRGLPIAILAGGALAAAGCGASVSVGGIHVDHKKAEKMLVDGITGGQIPVRSADCPGGIDAVKGKAFTCTFRSDGRSRRDSMLTAARHSEP